MFSDHGPDLGMEPEIPGFRFHPTPRELVCHHLKRKLQKVDDGNRCLIPEVNIYDYNPEDLYAVYNEKSYRKSTSSDIFFFCPWNKMNSNSGTTRTKSCNKRKAGDGYWKETSKKQDIEDEDSGEAIGTKRIFVFHKGNQKNTRKTELALHEYHLNAAVADEENIPDPTEFSVCHIKKKKQRKIGNTKKQQSKLNDSPCYEADSGCNVTPEMEGLDIPIQSENGSLGGSIYYPEQVGLGFEETISNAAFSGETTTHSQTPATMTPMFSLADFAATGTCGDEGNTVSNLIYDDGFSLDDLDIDFGAWINSDEAQPETLWS